MSYTYPPPGTPPPPYRGYPVAPHMAGMDIPSPNQPARTGSPTLSLDLKRANSRPNIKLDPSADDSTMAHTSNSKQKSRGGLNYHRISIACTNCRYRKIRCVPSESGKGRCMNCDRLDKSPCKFEPVGAAGSRTGSRHASKLRARLAVAASSRAISSGHTVAMHAPQQHHGPLTMPPIHQISMPDPPALKLESGITRYPDYGSPAIATWMSPDSATGSISRKHSPWGAPYGSHDTTPMTPSFAPYSGSGSSTNHNNNNNNHNHNHNHNSSSQPPHPHHHQTPHAPATPQQQSWPAPEPATAAGWASSAYPPPTPSGFSPLAGGAYVDRAAVADHKTTPLSAAEMYPPIPTMDPHHHHHHHHQQQQQQQHHHHHHHHSSSSSSSHGGAPLSPPGPAYGDWQHHHHQHHHQQAYPPPQIITQEPAAADYAGAAGSWFAAGPPEAAHAQAGMAVPDGGGYYTQR